MAACDIFVNHAQIIGVVPPNIAAEIFNDMLMPVYLISVGNKSADKIASGPTNIPIIIDINDCATNCLAMSPFKINKNNGYIEQTINKHAVIISDFLSK